jgi:hypothetical protein
VVMSTLLICITTNVIAVLFVRGLLELHPPLRLPKRISLMPMNMLYATRMHLSSSPSSDILGYIIENNTLGDIDDKPMHLSISKPLNDRFDRWRFLQSVLEEDNDARDSSDITAVLVAILRQQVQRKSDATTTYWNDHRRGVLEAILSDLTSPTTATTTSYPQTLLLHRMLALRDDDSDNRADSDDSRIGTTTTTLLARQQDQVDLSLLDQLEQLLPNSDDDDHEDAMKGLWDTVIELHGREAVKINERNASRQWRTRCLIARVLIYFDFLTVGR